MKKTTYLIVLLAIVFSSKSLTTNAQEVIFSEGFEDVTILPAMDWDLLNLSNPLGSTDWLVGSEGGVFDPYEGIDFIAANFNNTAGVGTISNWLITPPIELGDGYELSFWTRAADQTWPDRLEFRLSTEGAGSALPTNESDLGDFTELLLSINPDLNSGVYPEVWTQFTATISGVGAPVECRVAFRYYVTNSGPNGSNGNYIGIDAYEVKDFPISVEENTINGFTYFYASQTKELIISATDNFQSISMFNILGQEILNQNLSSNQETINLASFNNGIYIAHVTTQSGETATFKVVKR